MAQNKPLPSDYEELDFEITSEDWNRYELDTGVTIRGRVILAKITRDPNNPKVLNFDITPPKWAVYSPEHLRGKPTVSLLQDAIKQKEHPKHKVKVVTNHEPWNVYRIIRTGQELKIKLTVDDVYRFADAFDGNSSPLYDLPNVVAIAIKDLQEPGQ